MSSNMRNTRKVLLGATALAGALALMAAPASAQQQQLQFDLPAQPLDAALRAFAATADQQLIFADSDIRGRRAPEIRGAYSADEALSMLLAGTDLRIQRTASGVVQISAAQSPQGGSAAGDVDALIVTAQKREEDIQDVPIAISAFTQEALEAQKIEGGFDLLKAIPNVTFSKNNFTSYNFSIRGIGTKAVSATTDPGVAVSFNNIALLQNRLFEQEYFDIERVEVLRGPQGTLYGRNATAGVINVISAKPDLNDLEGSFKVEVGNYNSKRAQGMLNLPLIDDVLAVRLAGAVTSRDGYDFNSLTGNPVNGRDLWSARLTVGFNPTENIRANLIWERFNEDDDRSRTGKQLCHRDYGLSEANGQSLLPSGLNESGELLHLALFSQGCKPGNLYDDAAFGTPNGLALPFVFAFAGLSNDYNGRGAAFPLGFNPQTDEPVGLIAVRDPYAGETQSPDLRTIASIRDPRYRAKADVFQLNIDFDLGEALTFFSQTVYNKDALYSFQDFNRFNTQPIFNDTSNLIYRPNVFPDDPSEYVSLAPGGVFCDPQLGCSDRLVGFDISQAKSRQFGQEVRLQSDFDGSLNFSAGVNYTRFNVLVDYYVFYNLISAYAMTKPFNTTPGGVPGVVGQPFDYATCGGGNQFFGFGATEYPSTKDLRSICPYIDPNPIDSIDGEGHNYFRSKNPYKLTSTAAFGEVYWQVSDALKVTAGLRYTDDRKTFIPVPSQVLLAPGVVAGGTVSYGYPELPAIKQHWGEWTGRLGADWRPDLAFTDETMLYAFYSRGYKGGGANPPSPGFATLADYEEQRERFEVDPAFWESFAGRLLPVLRLTAVEYDRTFKPEFVNAFEVGAKSTLLGGALTFNTGAFLYDYRDYQVSQIRDRTAVNENFDATVWGLEFETRFAPSRDLQIIANLGYLDTKIADGEESIDIMDRTAGNEAWIVTKPWPQLPSNCIVPAAVINNWVESLDAGNPFISFIKLCGGVGGVLTFQGQPTIDDVTGLPYNPLYYDGTNGTVDIHGGAGIAKDLSGNELPNSPHWTVNLGAQYGMDWIDGWRATVRGDAYWQSQSWARVYNSDPYDKLHGWYNVNLSLWLEHEDSGVKVELYAKNLLDKTPITDAFLNSDDTALTTNVFVLDPRLVGLSIRKEF